MVILSDENITGQISVASKKKIDRQENWKTFSLVKPYERVIFLKSVDNLRIDDLSNRLKEMRNAMMKTRFT